jgi:hypothetical protein
VRVCTPAQIAEQQQLFFDMRHVSRAFEQLGGEAVRQFAEERKEILGMPLGTSWLAKGSRTRRKWTSVSWQGRLPTLDGRR